MSAGRQIYRRLSWAKQEVRTMQRNTAANHTVFKTVHMLTTGWFGMFFWRKIRSTVTSKALHKKLNWCVEKKLIKSAWCNNKRVKLWVLLLQWRLSTKRQKWGCVVHYNSQVRFPKFMADYVITKHPPEVGISCRKSGRNLEFAVHYGCPVCRQSVKVAQSTDY